MTFWNDVLTALAGNPRRDNRIRKNIAKEFTTAMEQGKFDQVLQPEITKIWPESDPLGGWLQLTYQNGRFFARAHSVTPPDENGEQDAGNVP